MEGYSCRGGSSYGNIGEAGLGIFRANVKWNQEAKSWVEPSCASPESAVTMTSVTSAKIPYGASIIKMLYRGLYYTQKMRKTRHVTRRCFAGGHQWTGSRSMISKAWVPSAAGETRNGRCCLLLYGAAWRAILFWFVQCGNFFLCDLHNTEPITCFLSRWQGAIQPQWLNSYNSSKVV